MGKMPSAKWIFVGIVLFICSMVFFKVQVQSQLAPGMTQPVPIAIDTRTTVDNRALLCAQYGVTAPYAMQNLGEAERDAIRQRLEYLHNLGVHTVLQSFSTTLIDLERQDEWLIFLDEARDVGIDVIVQIFPPNDWDGSQFDFTYHQAALEVIYGHPAVVGYYGLHEPAEYLTDDQIRSFYTTLKGYAPDLPIMLDGVGQFLTEPDNTFSDGMCDFCATWHFPFTWDNGDPVAEWDQVVAAIEDAYEMLSASDPDAQLWFRGQAFAQADPTDRRMPTPEEMLELARIVFESGMVDGFLWYPYERTHLYDASLADEGMEPQRQAILDAYEAQCPPAWSSSTKSASPAQVTAGQILTYTLVIHNNGYGDSIHTFVTDVWPSEVTFVPGSAWASSGLLTTTAGITWTGIVTRGQAVTITAQVTVSVPPGTQILNTASISQSAFTTLTHITHAFSVANGPMSTLLITPEHISLTTGATEQLSLRAYDTLGYPIPNPTATWSLANPAIGTINTTGLFAANWHTGTFTDIIIASAGELSDTSSVTILRPTLVVTPHHITLTMDERYRFQALAFDNEGFALPAPPVTWTLLYTTAGSLDPTGLFTAGRLEGTYSNAIMASIAGVTDTASVTIQPYKIYLPLVARDWSDF